MKHSTISTQHILRDLNVIASLLNRKNMDAIFVDIYSKDQIELNNCEERLVHSLNRLPKNNYRVIKSEADLQRLNMDKNSLENGDSYIDTQSLTSYSVFDSMGGEILLLNRYQFILEWSKKIKALIINPVTLALVSRWRVIFNIALLLATLIAYREIPSNTLVKYFIGVNNPLYLLIWVPYILRVVFDIKYLGRLYLLITEMSQKLIPHSRNKESIQTIILSSLYKGSVDQQLRLRALCRAQGVNLLRFRFGSSDSAEAAKEQNLEAASLNKADLIFAIPEMPAKEVTRLMATLSGLSSSEDLINEDEEVTDMTFEPMGSDVLEIFNMFSPLIQGSPEVCWRLFINYEFLCYRFKLNEREMKMLPLVLVTKLSDVGKNLERSDSIKEKYREAHVAFTAEEFVVLEYRIRSYISL